MSKEWKLVPVEPTQSMLDGMTTERKKGNGVLQMWFEALAAAPVPPAGGEMHDSAKMEFDRLAHAQVLAICRGAAAACTEQHSYMQGAKTDSKNWFPHKWVIDAIRNLIGINQSTCLTLRDDTTRLNAEVSALQQRLNIADQHVSDLEVEVAKLRRGPCELIYGDELPNQGIPGTSFQRLNALANEGE